MIKHLATEVVVIGGGIMGASTALFLRQHGVNVVMLERDLCGSRSSGVNFGGVRRQGRSLAMLPLSQRSHALWGRLTELIGTEAEYERSGHFKIARSEAAGALTSFELIADIAVDFSVRHGIGVRDPLASKHLWYVLMELSSSRDDARATLEAILERGSSLLPRGIKTITGNFSRGEVIRIRSLEGRDIAHGVSRYNSDALRRIAGQHSQQIDAILGYEYGPVAVHRDDMIIR